MCKSNISQHYTIFVNYQGTAVNKQFHKLHFLCIMIFRKLHLYMITTELPGLPQPIRVTSISVHEKVAPIPIHDDVAQWLMGGTRLLFLLKFQGIFF